MASTHIQSITVRDVRFPLKGGAGSDAVHTNPVYSYAVTQLGTDSALTGTGLSFTLGAGTELVCQAIEALARPLKGRDIEQMMAEFGTVFHQMAEHHQFRWLGPHKGVVHLALASITNACFDLWAKSRGVPLWKLLLDLTPEQILNVLDLSYLEDVLTREDASEILVREHFQRDERMSNLHLGYPAYSTGVGWFSYDEQKVKESVKSALDEGFRACKLKVGSSDRERDLRRAFMLRELVGPDIPIMLDANQQWSLPDAIRICLDLASMSPYWIEEPTHPDDVLAHQTLARAISPIPLALGEHVPNRVIFKNFLQSQAVGFLQVDCTRVGGVSEFLAVSLLARKFGVPVVPHVGDMGQIHQHLVLFNHIALGHQKLFLEYIPHLKDHFVFPAVVSDGLYRCPQIPGSSCDLKETVSS
jgi:L-fuconate dehydratase